MSSDENARSQNAPAAETIDGAKFPVWGNILLGTHKTWKDLKWAITETGHDINNWAEELLDDASFTLSDQEKCIDLFKFSPADIEFSTNPSTEDFFGRAKQLGFEICPAEAGPQLMLKCPDLQHGDWVAIAMQPLTDPRGDNAIFYIQAAEDDDGILCLGTDYENEEGWPLDWVFVFCKAHNSDDQNQ